MTDVFRRNGALQRSESNRLNRLQSSLKRPQKKKKDSTYIILCYSKDQNDQVFKIFIETILKNSCAVCGRAYRFFLIKIWNILAFDEIYNFIIKILSNMISKCHVQLSGSFLFGGLLILSVFGVFSVSIFEFKKDRYTLVL